MKKLNQKRMNILKVVGGLIGLVIFAFMFFNPITAIAAIAIAPIVGIEMTDKEEKFLNHVVDQVKAEIAKHDKGYISETKLNEVLTSKWKDWSKDLTEGELKQLNDALDKQGLEINSIKEHGGRREQLKSLSQSIVDAYKSNIDAIKAQTEHGGMMSLTVKSAATMTTANATGEDGLMESLESGLTRIARRIPFLRDLMNVAATSTPIIKYVEYINPDGDAGQTAEGAAKSQVDFDVVVREVSAKKTTAFIKVSEEMIEDIDFIQGEINNDLMERLDLKVDAGLMSGDGTGANLKGVTAYAPAFSAGTFAGTVPSANRFDVLKVAVATIIKDLFVPNYIVLNPLDVAAMELTKSSTGTYVFPPFSTADGTRISGLPVVQNTGVTAGTFLVGDFTKSNLRIRKEAILKVGYENDDFTKNLMTILVETRMVHYIKNNHLKAFVQGTFSTAITAITEEVSS